MQGFSLDSAVAGKRTTSLKLLRQHVADEIVPRVWTPACRGGLP